MKRKLGLVALALLILAGCASQPSASPDAPAAPNTESAAPADPGAAADAPQTVTTYDKNGLRFDVPETWAKNGFEAVAADTGTGESAYRVVTFYCTVSGQRIPVLTVSRFAAAQWDQLVAADKGAESVKLGTSKDNGAVYTFFVDELDVFESGAARDTLAQILTEAKSLRSAITITE